MSVILLACGILLSGAGIVAAGFGLPISDLLIGNTLIIVGAVAIVGGLQLIGLSAAVAELASIRKGQPVRLVAPSPRPAEPSLSARAAPEPVTSVPPELRPAAPAPSVDVSASVIERLRSNIPRPERTVPVAEDVPPLSPNGNHSASQTEPVLQASARPSNSAPPVEAREPRLDFLFRPRQTKPAPSENFDSMWPKRPGRGEPQGAPTREETQVTLRRDETQVALRRDETQVALRRDEAVTSAETVAPTGMPSPQETVARMVPEPVAPPPEPETPRSVAILKSGVVDGMAYTLYADGSIEAQLPQGTVRFGSIAELRAHIESTS